MLSRYNVAGALMCPISQMLCFTKFDLLKEAMARVPLCDVFPDYVGGSDVNAACEYFKHRFLSVIKAGRWRSVVVRYISTINTDQTLCALIIRKIALLSLCCSVPDSRTPGTKARDPPVPRGYQTPGVS
jgi:hypothetical protein